MCLKVYFLTEVLLTTRIHTVNFHHTHTIRNIFDICFVKGYMKCFLGSFSLFVIPHVHKDDLKYTYDVAQYPYCYVHTLDFAFQMDHRHQWFNKLPPFSCIQIFPFSNNNQSQVQHIFSCICIKMYKDVKISDIAFEYPLQTVVVLL